MNNTVAKGKKDNVGDCECCDKVQVEITTVSGIVMCVDCLSKQNTATEQLAATLIEQSRKIDTSIRIKADVMQAKTIPAIELKGAIDADDSIPADQKDYVMARESLARYQALQKAIFDDRAAILEKESEARVWQEQVQTFAGKLRSDIRAQFKNFDVNYAPVAPKTVKSPSKAPVKAFKKSELADAVKKYNVNAIQVQMMATQRNITAEAAAKMLSELLAAKKKSS